MSRKSFEGLSHSDRELVLAVAKESVPYMRGLWDRMEAESREAVLKGGVQAVDVDRAAFKSAVQPVLRHYLERHDLHDLHAAVRALA